MDSRLYIKQRLAEAKEAPKSLADKLNRLTKAKVVVNETIDVFEDFLNGEKKTESRLQLSKRSRTTAARAAVSSSDAGSS